MPDDDRFPRYLAPAWRKVLRSLQGRDTPERLGDVVTQALAATLRAVHGVPSLPDLAERMRDAAVRGQLLELRLTPDVRHVPTDIAEQIAATLATSMQRELALVSPTQAVGLLAQRLLAGLAYHYGFDRMVRILVIEVAAMAYAADRMSPRPPEREGLHGSGWDRRIWLQIPVREPARWTAVADRLAELLGWLTHDHWSLEFSQLEPGFGALDSAQGFLFDSIPRGSTTALFSGGLDSALGLSLDLPACDPIVVSVHTNSRMQAVQRHLVSRLSGRDGRCVHLQYRISLCERDEENSQRTRGLLFLAVGIGTAWGIGQDRLRVFENGIGAINLPYLRSQHGPQATRSMHPRTLWLAECLASAAGGRPFRIEAPFMLSTKAEAVAAARADADAATAYRTRKPADTDAFVAMSWQLDRLRTALADPDPWYGLISEFPSVLDVVLVPPSEVIRLYRTYNQEWEAIGPDLGPSRDGRTAAL